MTDPHTFVIHSGALGDSVLLWPYLRAMKERGERITLVAPESKARLAARFIGVEWESIESPTWTALWRKGTSPEHTRGVSKVFSFVSDGVSGIWSVNAVAMFPGATIDVIERKLDRVLALELAAGGGNVPLRVNPLGTTVLHVGAGSESKRWPMDEWEMLASVLATEGPVEVLAGEVEAERFSKSDRTVFDRLGGRFIDSLDALADNLQTCKLMVGCDSGPAHLAAQIGVPTVAVFRCTDPVAWGPIGPRVVIATGNTDSITDACRRALGGVNGLSAPAA